MTQLFKKIILILILIIIVFVLFNVIKIQDIIQKKIYPLKYEEYVCKYADEYNVDKYLIFAIIKAESNFDANANSNKQAKGLMQIMEQTAEEIAEMIDLEIIEDSLLDPKTNINLGTKYISILLKKYGNIELALAAYNAGSGNVDEWIEKGVLKEDGSNIENVPYKETNNYIRKILRDYNIYKKIYTETNE